MRHIIFLIFIIYVQVSFAQYTFKFETKITELIEIPVEDKTSKDSGVSKTSNGIDYYSKTYKTNFGDTLKIKPKISIYVKNDDEIDKVVKQFGNKLSFKKKIGWVFVYICNVRNSDEVLEITTILSKDERVIACDAFTDIKMELFNTLYSKQYYLHDNSLGSVGINMESVWKIVPDLSQNITVAVIDEGVEHNHEDLPNVVDGYSAGITSGNGDPMGSPNAHGTACAGIIGGADNSVGIRGIASNVKILPVNICTSWDNQESKYVFVDEESIADAIVWASERADVLSCSWGNGKGTENTSITLAIKKALSEGRNGKGCVVVFASGNYYQYFQNLSFPASVEGVISVGAVDKTGKIWNYSQRGKGLSLVAPSGNVNLQGDIVTTDRMGNLGYEKGNYTEHFGGTSAACPQVAGVAALLLSLRPDLTAAEVKDVLQRTATDLGATGYDTIYGYGLLNASAAVEEVMLSIHGNNEAKSSSVFSIDNFPMNATVSWSVDEKDKEKIKLTLSGDGNKTCTAEIIGTKTVKTKLTAVVKVGTLTVATLTKNITLIGTLSGTYSVTATTVSGVSLPAIVNRPFSSGSTLEGHPGSTITINSDDIQYYSVSKSGSAVQGWTVGLDFIRFSYPLTAAGSRTRLDFTGKIAGPAMLQVYVVGPSIHSLSIIQDGEMLGISIKKEEIEEDQYEAEEVSKMSMAESSENAWTIEVVNVTTGMRKEMAVTSTGECQFNTSGWQPGIYLIRATNGIETISKKITIK